MLHYFTKLENITRQCWNSPGLCNYQGEQFTFGEVATSIEKFHIFFEKAGIRKGDRIAICARNCARWAVSFLATNTYEAVVVPILADFTPESVMSLMEHSESMMLFTDPDMWEKLDAEKMPSLRAVVSVKDFSLLYCTDKKIKESYANLHEEFKSRYPLGFSGDNVKYPTDNDKDLAVINYTSGTTSAPKGVMLRFESFSATIEYAQTNVKAKPNTTIVSMLPMAHMYGLAFEFLYPYLSGVAVYYLGKTPSPSTLIKAMQEVKPYLLITVPLVMEKIYKSSIKPVLDKKSMKILTAIPGLNNIIYNKISAKIKETFGGNIYEFIMGGAPLNPEVEKCFRKIHLPYCVGYGMTEACPLLAYSDYHTFAPGSCGRPVDCAEVRIDSEDPLHIAGEIQAKGTNICMGYFNNPEASANAFTEDGFLRTGDLGVMDEKGNIYIRGRSKSMILTANGQNVYPEEVEAVVNSQDYVAESVVVDRSSKLVALVYLDEKAMQAAGLDAEAVSDVPENIRVSANRLLPSYSQLTKVEVMTEPFAKTPKLSIKRFLYK
ncbi:MAG: AMP-binding protein [Bacteroidia bacterium]|nr:AMP-binding protein [Bacteroidia bacterium]